MELKYQNYFLPLRTLISFNRTFMELKYRAAAGPWHQERRFNRTFMELKYNWVFRSQMERLVLIVPLWN